MKLILFTLALHLFASGVVLADPERDLLASDLKKAVVKLDMESIDKLYSWKGVHEIHRDQEWMSWEQTLKSVKGRKFVGVEWVPASEMEEFLKDFALRGVAVRGRLHRPNLAVKGAFEVRWEEKAGSNVHIFWVLAGKDEEGKWRAAATTVEKLEDAKR